MAQLKPWLPLAAALLAAAPASPASGLTILAPGEPGGVDHWSVFIAEASARFGIPDEWIRRVMRAESGGRIRLNGRPIVSHAGAMGLMQLMPGTWREMRAAHGLGHDPHQPRDNILAGTAYLRAMYDRFGHPGLFGAYNAGPARYAQHLRGRRLPGETVAYMAAVTGGDRTATRPAQTPSMAQTSAIDPVSVQAPPLFAVLSPAQARAPHPEAGAGPAASASLFVPLREQGEQRRRQHSPPD
jgi:hypothetical protein